MSSIDKNCTYLISTEKSTSIQQEDICKDLESNEINNNFILGKEFELKLNQTVKCLNKELKIKVKIITDHS